MSDAVAGTIEAVASKRLTSPITKCGVHPEARNTGSHCGGQATACSASVSLPAVQGLVVYGMKAAQKAAARTTAAREVDACFFACTG